MSDYLNNTINAFYTLGNWVMYNEFLDNRIMNNKAKVHSNKLMQMWDMKDNLTKDYKVDKESKYLLRNNMKAAFNRDKSKDSLL